jgi:hypothetical protein
VNERLKHPKRTSPEKATLRMCSGEKVGATITRRQSSAVQPLASRAEICEAVRFICVITNLFDCKYIKNDLIQNKADAQYRKNRTAEFAEKGWRGGGGLKNGDLLIASKVRSIHFTDDGATTPQIVP